MSIFSFFRFGRSAIENRYGVQISTPTTSLIEDTPLTNVDAAFQISTVWRAVEIRSVLISTLPIMVYRDENNLAVEARDSMLWTLLHDSPNSRMTPAEFWTALQINLLLRGNAYARIQRNARTGEAEALWPMPADQVEYKLLKDGTEVYYYRIGEDVAVLSSENVLHLKGMGNGNIGLARLDYMRTTIGESINSQRAANKLFANGGKPTGILMVDSVLKPEQRKQLQDSFQEMATGSTSRLFVLEASMKYQQINLTPEDIQLLSTRQYTVQEIGRWFGVPAILLNQTEGTTTLGSSSNDIIESFYKLTIRPEIVFLEQALKKRVMTSKQRTTLSIKFNMDALLRASLKDRMEIYAKAVQNGIFSRNECRQLENDPPYKGGELFTAQSNLMPIDMLGQQNIASVSHAAQTVTAQ
jgi:HK97 family phage portal protein